MRAAIALSMAENKAEKTSHITISSSGMYVFTINSMLFMKRDLISVLLYLAVICVPFTVNIC